MSERLERHIAFLERQEQARKESFDPAKLIETGIRPSQAMKEGRCGYIAAYRHPNSVMEAVSDFAIAISSEAPSFNYDSSNLHTTLVTFYNENGVGRFDTRKADRVCEVVDILKSSGTLASLDPRISYGKPLGGDWLYSSDSVIVLGKPNKAFVDLAYNLADMARDLHPNSKPSVSWGAHMTTNRFTTKRTKIEKLVAFQMMMKAAPSLGESQMVRLDVCHYTLDKDGFTLSVYESF